MAVAPGHDAGSAPDGSEADGGAARATAAHSGEGSVLVILLTLTVLSGLIDGVCYLGLGRVFTANMTGNVVILGFAAAGAPWFSVPASLTSLGLFLVGADCGGQVSRSISRRSRLLVAAAGITAVAAFVGRAGAYLDRK